MSVTPRQRSDVDAPLDFSFLNITEMIDFSEEPREGKRKVERVKIPPENEEDEPQEKFNSRCVLLSNNLLQDLKGFTETLDAILLEPLAVTWVDLSFNELSKIDACLCDLPNLTILYLHGNSINEISEVDKISGMPKLIKLTLHGNTIETVKNYRQYVVSCVPQLKELDFSVITKADRATASYWKKTTPQKKKKKKSED